MRFLPAVLLLVLTALPTLAQVPPPWEPLGGVEDESGVASAIAPLADGTVLLLRGELVLRRAPGGSWVEVLRGARGTYLAAARGERPLALAVLATTPYLSLDAGLTWRQVDLPAGSPWLDLSPAFDLDATAVYRSDGRLFLTRDGGLSWTELTPAAGQRVHLTRFSPDFGRDRTLFAAVVSGPFPSLMLDTPAQSAADEHEASAGLLVSTDGGSSWTGPGAGPSVEGVPFRQIQAMAVSPAFAADRTLYAYAWGPRVSAPFMGGGPARTWEGALFRTRDAGATWELVRPSGGPSFQRGFASIELSPSLELDDTLFLSLSVSGASPASSGCQLFRSTDAGLTWSELVQRGSYEGCIGVVVSPRYTEDRAVLFGKMGWLASLDGGSSFEALGPQASTSAEPIFAPDLWLYVAGRGGAWRRPPFPDRADLPPCSLLPAGGFGRLWRANDRLRASIGCPVEPEQRLAVRLDDAADGRYLQVAPELAPFLLAADGSLRPATLELLRPEGWAEVQVISQRYAGGFLLWRSGQPATITAIDSAAGRWREFPDLEHQAYEP